MGEQMIDKFIEYAPLIIIVTCYLLKNKIFVMPEKLKEESKAIIDQVKSEFLSLVAFREFEKRIEDNFTAIHSALQKTDERFNHIDTSLDHIKDLLIKQNN